ncbi:MAG: pre-peptidase [Actinomycetota bacterium]
MCKHLLPILLLCALAPAAHAQTGYPMITSAYPLGCRRGETTQVTVSGSFNFAGAYGTLFESNGLSAEVVPPAMPLKAGQAQNQVTLKVTVAPDAPLGPQEFRIATPRGVSSIGMLVIGTEPEILEKEGNNLLSEAGAIELPAAVEGRIQANEDVDHFKFQVNAGDQVVFSCTSSRLQDKIHDLTPGGGGAHSDPILVLLDETGRELATADDYYGPDPLLAHRFDKAGTFVIQVRDVRYQGMAGWTYRLICTRNPFLTALYPMAGQRGQAVEVQPIGFNLGAMKQTRIEVPMMEPGAIDVQVKAGDIAANPMPFVVSDLPQTLETDDNDDPAKATPAPMPGGYNGRIEKEGDVDGFRFKGVKGQSYSFEVNARRYDSSLDSYLQILDAAGKPLANNDDAEGKDSRIDWGCPADGEYIVQIRDLHSRGGDSFVYNISAAPGKTYFSLRCDDDKALVGPGSGYAMYVLASRRDGFAGDIQLTVENLPPGVTMTSDRVRAGMTQSCVVFRAAPDAKPDFRRIRMYGTAEVTLPDGKKETIRREVTALQEIYMPGGGRSYFDAKTHVVSATEPSDVLQKLNTNKAELKPGGPATIEVEVVRQKGYDKNLVLDVYLRHLGRKYGDPLPRGVSLDESASKTLLGPTDTKGKIVLKAAADAPEIDSLPIAILGQVSINFVVKVSHASEPVLISVKK